MTAICKEEPSLLDIRHSTLQDKVKVIRQGDAVSKGRAHLRIFIQSFLTAQMKMSNCAKTLLIVKEKTSTAQIWIAAKKFLQWLVPPSNHIWPSVGCDPQWGVDMRYQSAKNQIIAGAKRKTRPHTAKHQLLAVLRPPVQFSVHRVAFISTCGQVLDINTLQLLKRINSSGH